MSKLHSCLLLIAAAVVPGLADDASKSAKIEELLSLTNSRALMEQQFGAVDKLMRQQMQQMNLPADAEAEASKTIETLSAALRDRLSWDRLKPEFVRIYSQTFSEEEIDGILQFYRTKAGQALLAKMPLLMTNTMEMVGRLTGELMQDFRKKIEDIGKRYPQPKKS